MPWPRVLQCSFTLCPSCACFTLGAILLKKKPRPRLPVPGRGFSLLQRRADRTEGAAELSADALHGGDDRNRDTCGNQAVFHCGDTALVRAECKPEYAYIRA